MADPAGVRGIPFVVLYRDGQPAAQTVGAQPKAALERALELEPPVAAVAAEENLRVSPPRAPRTARGERGVACARGEAGS